MLVSAALCALLFPASGVSTIMGALLPSVVGLEKRSILKGYCLVSAAQGQLTCGLRQNRTFEGIVA